MRGVLLTGTESQIFLYGYFIASIWAIGLFYLLRKMENYAKRTGFYQKYG